LNAFSIHLKIQKNREFSKSNCLCSSDPKNQISISTKKNRQPENRITHFLFVSK
jgi:hypothetical protein